MNKVISKELKLRLTAKELKLKPATHVLANKLCQLDENKSNVHSPFCSVMVSRGISLTVYVLNAPLCSQVS